MSCNNVVSFSSAAKRNKAKCPVDVTPLQQSDKTPSLSDSDVASSHLIFAFITKHILSQFNATLQIGTDQDLNDRMLWMRIKPANSQDLRSISNELLVMGVLCGCNSQCDYVDIPSLFIKPEWIEHSNRIEFVRFHNITLSDDTDEAVDVGHSVSDDVSANSAISLCQYRAMR